MKSSIIKKVSICLSMMMIFMMITGCGANTKSNKGSVKGGYEETKVTLPDDISSQFIISMTRNDSGKPALYACDNDRSKKGIYKYEQDEDEKWEKNSIEWLRDLDLTGISNMKLCFGQNGEEYLLCEQDVDGWLYAHLYKKSQDNKAEEIKLEGWDLSTDDPNYEYPKDIIFLKDGNILVLNYCGDSAVFDKESYKKLQSYSVKERDVKQPKVIVDGERIVSFTGNGKNQEADSITYFDENFNKEDKIDFEKPKRESAQDFYIDGNEIVMLNSDGIHIGDIDTKMWETIIDADKTALSSPSYYEYMMMKGNDKEYYVLYMTMDEGFELLKYSYDESISNETESEISIYSLVENSAVRDAVTLLQRKHTNIKVNYKVSINDKEENKVNKNDYIKTLNTEILSGKGPDILILDDLPVDSYIEKGGLADLSDVINPMVEKNELLTNVVDKNRINEKIYSIPTRISIPVIYGDREIVQSASSLDDLVKYSENNKGMKIFGNITYEDLMKQFLPENVHEFYNDKVVDKEALVNFLTKIKTIGDNSMALSEYKENERMSNTYSLASESKALLRTSKSILDAEFEIAVTEHINGDFASYENSYVPSGRIGINASSKQLDLCKEFVKTLLDSEVQDKDYYDGFPINTKSLETCRSITRNDKSETEIENSDGSFSLLSVTWPGKENIDKLIDICENASNEVVNEEVFFSAILENSKEFFKGNMESDKCADLIVEDAKVYLEE